MKEIASLRYGFMDEKSQWREQCLPSGSIKFIINLFLLIFSLLSAAAPAQAGVVTDGSIGNRLPIAGFANRNGQFIYPIGADAGTQSGANLFHSFADFNLSPHEIAWFSGPDSVARIISRVTGGSASQIDGMIYADIPGADFYFINPAGVVFGENVRIEVPRSFYASSADYLAFADGSRFEAGDTTTSRFSIASPENFGFLDAAIAPIEMHHSQLARAPTDSNPPTFALVGGDIHLEETTLYYSGGYIDVVSAGGSGEVPVDFTDLSEIRLSAGGTLRIHDTTPAADSQDRIGNLVTLGEGGGRIRMYAGEVELDNAYVFADNVGDAPAQGIAIRAEDNVALVNGSRLTADALALPEAGFAPEPQGNGGNISIQAQNLSVRDGSQITATTATAGHGGTIMIQTALATEIAGQGAFTSRSGGEEILYSGIFSNTAKFSDPAGSGGTIVLTAGEALRVYDGGEIRADTLGTGDGGQITVEAERVVLSDGGQINVSSGNLGTASASDQALSNPLGMGHAGDLYLTAGESVQISGQLNPRRPSGLLSNVSTQGRGGTLHLSAPTLSLHDGGVIQSSTESSGDAGRVVLALDHLEIDSGAGIATLTGAVNTGADRNLTPPTGGGGDIHITAQSIHISGAPGALPHLSSQTTGPGHAGNIRLQTGSLVLEAQAEINATTRGGGEAGTITLQAEQVRIVDAAQVTTASEGTRDGGEIVVDAAQIVLTDGGTLSSNAYGDGQGGSILVGNAEQVNIRAGGQISAVSTGQGDAGDITLRSQNLSMQQGRITTRAEQAGGGNVSLEVSRHATLQDSQVLASARGQAAEHAGGNIRVAEPARLISERSALDAGAKGGPGGNIFIVAEIFVQSAGSTLNVTSELGVDGQVLIESPDQDALENLSVVSTDMLDTRQLSPHTCHIAHSGTLPSRLVQVRYAGRPPAPDSWHSVEDLEEGSPKPTEARVDNRMVAFHDCQQEQPE